MKESAGDKLTIGFMYAFISIFTALCLFPLLITLGVSLTKETEVIKYGYSIIPRAFSLSAYEYIAVALGDKLLRGYGVTLFVTAVGTAASMLVTSMYAYAASVKTFKHRNILAMLAYIPMVFSAGILPWFIVLTRYYHLSNKVYALIVPCLMNLFYVFLIRNFFSAVPVELSEAAKIDGAGHARIFTTIVVPVARVGLITVALFYALGYWNDFYMALMFISKQEFYPLQYFLYTMLTNAEFAAMNSQTLGYRISVPLETIKMALTCVTIGPIVLLFPFIQKYFAKGIVVGGIKG